MLLCQYRDGTTQYNLSSSKISNMLLCSDGCSPHVHRNTLKTLEQTNKFSCEAANHIAAHYPLLSVSQTVAKILE